MNGDPLLRKIVIGEFVKFHIWVVSAVLVGLFTWVWNTSAQVADTTERGLRSEHAVVELVPKIQETQTDVAVIKERQKNMEGKVAEVNSKLDVLLDRAMLPHR